ncbi:MAG: serine hydrolase domain-containing protein [Gemmatimonadaceae bacterium]|nr:serine hydrolase domain-containing protein [Gemmatimonadaceae bacterium]
MKRFLVAASLATLAQGPLAAQKPATFWRPTPQVTATAGFSPERLLRIDRFMKQYVDDNRIAGAVGLVMRDGRVVYEHAVGWSDKESGRTMAPDAMFRIASQTKAITSEAIMMLIEEGKIALGDPVSRFIPAYAKTTVAAKSDTGLAILPARRAITIRDLLTHTAGISYGTDASVTKLYEAKALGPAAGWGWYTADKDEIVCATMERLATLPFVAQPGETFVYGYGTDVLGCVVERASGVALDEFLRTRITEPLGMKDTYFFVPKAKRDRLSTVYASTDDGRVTRAPDGPRGQGNYVDGPRRSFAGGAGLVSTARDYARFLQMTLNGGMLDGVRLLAPKTIQLMATNMVGTMYSSTGLGFGLGFETVDTFGASGLSSQGTYGWGGAYGSIYRVDPKERLVTVFMIQQLPNRTDIAAKFPTLVYQALVEPKR